jgi:hypothetical protein
MGEEVDQLDEDDDFGKSLILVYSDLSFVLITLCRCTRCTSA